MAAGLSCFGLGDEKIAAEYLEKLWLAIDPSEIFKNWDNGGIIRGLLFESCLLDSTPEQNFLNKTYYKFNHTLKRNMTLGLTDFNTPKFVSDKKINDSNWLIYAMASSANPGMFPAIEYDDTIYVDGGVYYRIDLVSSINYCRNQGYEDKNIIIDAIYVIPSIYPYFNSTGATSLDMANRYLEMNNLLKSTILYYDTTTYYKEVNFRYMVILKITFLKPVLKIFPLDTNPKRIREAFELGYNDTRSIINCSKISYIKERFDFLTLYAH